MGQNHGPIDGRHKKVWQQYDSNNKKARSNHNCFVAWHTWISYSNYNEDETFSSELVDPGKMIGWSVEKRGYWNMAKNHSRNEGIIYHFCTETYWRWNSTSSLFLWCIRESIGDCHLLKDIIRKKSWCQPTIFEIENCTKAEDANTLTQIAALVNWYKKSQVCINRSNIGEYPNNRMGWFAMCIKLDQDQETAINLCSKQINWNHRWEECQIPLYP